jgi:hypothetical protein
MIENIIQEIELPKLINILVGVVAFFIAYLKILPLIPRSANKILSDIEVYEKVKKSDIDNVQMIKASVEREIRRKYRKPIKIYNYTQFLISLIVACLLSYFIYWRIIDNKLDTPFYFLSLLNFMAIAVLANSFDEPEKKKNDSEEKIVIREPVFKFEIFRDCLNLEK